MFYSNPAMQEHLLRSVSHFCACVMVIAHPPGGPWLCHTYESDTVQPCDQNDTPTQELCIASPTVVNDTIAPELHITPNE